MSFGSVAAFYNEINGAAFKPYADYLEACFKQAKIPVREVLDLGCGTGAMCALLADKGYDMIGVDNSYDMLNLAYEANGGKNTLLLCQDMRSFELYGTVQAVYSSFDCLNYLNSAEDLCKVFSLVHNYLEPGGVFAFDVNTQYRYENVFDGKAYIYESGDDMLIWRSALAENKKTCEFVLDMFFVDKDGGYMRETELQKQVCFTRDDILRSAKGFKPLSVTGGKGFDGCTGPEKEYFLFIRE